MPTCIQTCVLTYLHTYLDPLKYAHKQTLIGCTSTLCIFLQVFFLKMKGDYHRYLAEFAEGAKQKEATKTANDCYLLAIKAATGLVLKPGPVHRDDKDKTVLIRDPTDASEPADKVYLVAVHPIRLGLMLNYSVFLYEIIDEKIKAKWLAEQVKRFDMFVDVHLCRCACL